MSGRLVVIRGSSGSGKTTVSTMIHHALERGSSALIAQDTVRRTMLRDKEAPNTFTIELIESIARSCLDRGLITIVEGILPAEHYDEAFARLRQHAGRAVFYAYDLEFEETARRHAYRAGTVAFTTDDMREWYHGWNPLGFVEEHRIGPEVTADQLAARILADLRG